MPPVTVEALPPECRAATPDRSVKLRVVRFDFPPDATPQEIADTLRQLREHAERKDGDTGA